jgi:hypothetical protein
MFDEDGEYVPDDLPEGIRQINLSVLSPEMRVITDRGQEFVQVLCGVCHKEVSRHKRWHGETLTDEQQDQILAQADEEKELYWAHIVSVHSDKLPRDDDPQDFLPN